MLIHGGNSADWLHHFNKRYKYHLRYNLALLLPGFALLAYYFMQSGLEAVQNDVESLESLVIPWAGDQRGGCVDA